MVRVFYCLFNLHPWTGGWTPRKALSDGLGWMSDARELFDQNAAGQESKRPMWFLKETEKESEEIPQQQQQLHHTYLALCVEGQRQ